MFWCGKCKKLTEPGEQRVMHVIETREKEYENYGKVSYGQEIVREIPLCPRCAEKMGVTKR